MSRIALEASERRFRALTEKAQGLTVVCNAEGQVSYANPASRLLLGKAPEALQGSNIFDWIHPDDAATAHSELADVVAFRNSGFESIVRFGHSDGSWRYLASLANNCLSDSAVAGIVLNLRDVTGRKRAEDALQRLADHDALTDLPNRRYAINRISQALAFSVTRSRRPNALFYLDLDDFKSINDMHGHRAGDLVLRIVAERLKACVRVVDTVSRFGGDEFVVLLEDFETGWEAATSQTLSVGEKILAALSRPYDLDGHVYTSTCSLGVTLFGDKHETVDDIVRRADRSLYDAKNAGRNAFRFG